MSLVNIRRGNFYKIVEEKILLGIVVNQVGKNYGLNNNSIGIELDNPGHGINYKRISKNQMRFFSNIIKKIFLNIILIIKMYLAHSDIAPERKADPGELFNWNYLAKKIFFYPPIKKNQKKRIFFFNLVTLIKQSYI